MHAAKGLEWQVVAVPHLVTGVFPGRKIGGTWLTSPAELPVPLRGDAADLPGLALPDGGDRKQLEEAVKQHSEALDERRLTEERRLAYVALTRAERVLLVSGHRWGTLGDRPREPSPYLVELAAGTTGAERWADETDEPDPATAEPLTALWPVDPLGARSAAVHAGAELVRGALRELDDRRAARAETAAPGTQLELLDLAPESDRPQTDPAAVGPISAPEVDDPEGWAADVDVLLAERAAARARPSVALPAQLSVSQLVELAADPAGLAAALRRPLPLPPNPHARRGTAFHAWLEQRFGAAQLLDLDELPGAADEGAASDDALAELQEAFLASPWADRRPIEVEVPFETTIAGVGVRGRMDAVFADPDGGYTVIDWKTGALPDEARLPALDRAARGVPAGLGGAGRVRAGPGAGRVPLRAARGDAAARPTCWTPTACTPWSPPCRPRAEPRRPGAYRPPT